MSFVSFEFAFFVIALLLIYYLMPAKIRWIVLLAASSLFYAICGIRYIFYIIFTIISTYIAARCIERIFIRQKAYLAENKESLSREDKKSYKSKCRKSQLRILWLCVLLNFGILFFMKYANLTIAYFNMYRLNITGNMNFVPFLDIVLPLGISFYTFQIIGYLADVYYERVPALHNIFKLALFTSFFPQIVQGPISRYNDLAPQFFEPKDFDFYNIKSGFYRICWGLFKKLVVADRVASYVTQSMDMQEYYRGGYILLGIFFYAFQIYCDFSGGIDITIGVSEMLGIRLTENFMRPFFSKSISEYWTRWHITLGTWFKDYIFYPLSVNKTVLKWGKWFRNHKMIEIGKRVPIYVPMLGVWVLTGMWHGSEMRYVYWGLLNCLFIILGTEFNPISNIIMEKLSLKEEMFVVKLYRVVKTFWLMSFLRVFDICKDAPTAVHALRGVLSPRGWRDFSFALIPERFSITLDDIKLAFIGIAVVIIFDLIQGKGSVRERIFKKPVAVQWIVLSVLIVSIVLFGAYGIGYDASSFVYMQF